MRPAVEQIFHEVADISADARARYFAERQIDQSLQSEVEALLAFDLPSTASLDRNICRLAEGALERFDPRALHCGPYRLRELLGRGGMGAVYSAERIDGELKQRVAVKLLRPGADDPQLRQRFLAERQILATLSHPNIARLLDAGHQSDGQPYLVMEYADGKPIDVYAGSLGVRQIVVLFLKVCDAVGYLHRNLVVHRDLKPGNILVTDEGEPKLLDFGIAKLLDLAPDSTITGVRMLTPDYASPEQVTGAPVTTATDIYSLGAVLYKLLTGRSPHQFENDSMESITSTICQGKISPPSKLAPEVKGDLEMILLKALRTEPQERYGSIEQFSGDLENYLQSRPIRARKGDAWYRTRKFLRRHWLTVAAATLTIAGLSGGLAIANRERALAQRRFLEVRQLANKLFDIDVEVRKLSGSTKTRQLIVDTSLEYLRRLSSEGPRDPALDLELGNAYMRVARVQGVPISQNLGQMDEAEQNLRVAEGFVRSGLVSQPSNRTALLRSAQIAHDRMILARHNGRYPEALEFARKSAEWLEKFQAGSGDKAEYPAILLTYLNVADELMLSRKFDEALRLCRRGGELARSFDSQSYLGTLYWVSGEIFRRQGNLDEALKETHESASILERAAAKSGEHGLIMNLILAQTYEGSILGEPSAINLGRHDAAVALLERAFTTSDELAHQDPSDQSSRGRLALSGITLADILARSKPRRALAVYDHVLRHMSEFKANSSFRRFEVSALSGSSYSLRLLGQGTEAQRRLNAAFEELRQLKDYPSENIKPGSEPEVAIRAKADYDASKGNLAEAINAYTKLLDQLRVEPETNLEDAVRVSSAYAALAALYRRGGRADLASALETRRLQLWQHWDAEIPHNNFIRRELTSVERPFGDRLLSRRFNSDAKSVTRLRRSIYGTASNEPN